MHNKFELDQRMIAAGIRPLKKLGQNFLLNPKICQAIVDCSLRFKPSTVVEIGPGLGALTDSLVGNIKLVLIEVDGGLVEYWKKVLPDAEIIHQDALKLNWDLKWEHPTVLVSNLPYSIAASLVVDLSVMDHPFDSLVLMFQKEVAERIQAKFSSSDYGMLSVIAQTFWDIDKVIDAGPQDFFPVPHIGSRVLEFVPKKTNVPRQKFLSFVKQAYSQRRKKLSTNLSAHYPKPRIEEAFLALNLGPDTRAQELTPPAFVQLFNHLSS
jgi:16S rRNA (adenine1518-N6/adenine1519-N6)-dimethyltransferase